MESVRVRLPSGRSYHVWFDTENGEVIRVDCIMETRYGEPRYAGRRTNWRLATGKPMTKIARRASEAARALRAASEQDRNERERRRMNSDTNFLDGIAMLRNTARVILSDAIVFATEAHRGQDDKSDQPYILHPLRVMLRGRTLSERVVGVLHDVVEDCGVTVEALRERFGAEIADAVDAISHRKTEGEDYDDYMARCKANPIARRVKLHDFEDNLDLKRITTGNYKIIARERFAKHYALLREELERES